MRAPIAIAVAAALFAPLAHAEAESWPLGEAIEVGESRCMTRDELVASISTWLGRDSIDRRIHIVVEELEDGRTRFVVRREGAPIAERRFRPTEIACADLRAAVGLAIALAIDATVLNAIVEPAPAPAPAAEPPEHAPRPVRPATPPPALPPSAPEPPARPSLEAEAQLMVLFGVLPAPTWGGSIGASLPIGSSFALRAAGFATASADVTVGTGSAEVAMAAGLLEACLERALGRASMLACTGAGAGRWSARGESFYFNRSTALPWAAMTAGLALRIPLADGVLLSTHLDGYVPFMRPELLAHDVTGAVVATTEAPPAGMTASLGLTVQFP
jgi:hypothetical protein